VFCFCVISHVTTSEIKLKQNCFVSVLFQFYFRCNHCLTDIKAHTKNENHGLCKPWATSTNSVFICPTAVAYSMGQIIKPVCVCQYVFVGTHTVTFLDRFTPKLPQMQEPPKVKTSSLGVNVVPPFPSFFSPKPHLGQKVLKPMQILLVINVGLRKSPKFSRHIGNGDRGTRW